MTVGGGSGLLRGQDLLSGSLPRASDPFTHPGWSVGAIAEAIRYGIGENLDPPVPRRQPPLASVSITNAGAGAARGRCRLN